MLFSVGESTVRNWQVIVESERDRAALEGRSLPPPKESILARDYARRLTAVMKSLEVSRLRGLGLWKSNDWVCWLSLLALFAVLTIAFWWYMSMHS
jgi:hypothetical protein